MENKIETFNTRILKDESLDCIVFNKKILNTLEISDAIVENNGYIYKTSTRIKIAISQNCFNTIINDDIIIKRHENKLTEGFSLIEAFNETNEQLIMTPRIYKNFDLTSGYIYILNGSYIVHKFKIVLNNSKNVVAIRVSDTVNDVIIKDYDKYGNLINTYELAKDYKKKCKELYNYIEFI